MKDYPEKKSSHSDTMGVINGELTCFYSTTKKTLLKETRKLY
jgi:hypothetical protein